MEDKKPDIIDKVLLENYNKLMYLTESKERIEINTIDQMCRILKTNFIADFELQMNGYQTKEKEKKTITISLKEVRIKRAFAHNIQQKN